ncbi:MAG TPA: T9SS type A sorting domain-containing protein [Cyclobacteriaceae bacterium]
MRKNIGILISFMLITSYSLAVDHYTRASGDWETGAMWGNTTSGTGDLWSTRTITAGDKIYIDDAMTLNSILAINVDVTIYLSAVLTVDGQLDLTTNSKIIFTSSSGRIIGTPPGNSDKIKIGPGNTVWSTSNGNITGPGTLDQNSTNGALPISLLFFKLNSVSPEGILFDWATASELNFDHFNVQRSFNGKDFETISEVKGNGTTKERHDYSYIDKFPINGTSYYRIQSIDFDGYTETFNVVAVKFESGKRVALYPNPVTDSNLNIQLNFQPASEILVTVTSVTGIERVREVIKTNEANLNLGLALEPGVYIVKMASMDFSKVSRIVVK